jgi:hypothetical protein
MGGVVDAATKDVNLSFGTLYARTSASISTIANASFLVQFENPGKETQISSLSLFWEPRLMPVRGNTTDIVPGQNVTTHVPPQTQILFR